MWDKSLWGCHTHAHPPSSFLLFFNGIIHDVVIHFTFGVHIAYVVKEAFGAMTLELHICPSVTNRREGLAQMSSASVSVLAPEWPL